MVLLSRKKQLAGVLQADDSLASGLATASNASTIVLDLEANLDVERIERNLTSDTITANKDLAGQKAVDVTFGVELLGAGVHANGAPEWSKYLRACGMEEAEIAQLSIGSITGAGSQSSTTFRHGETITGGTSSATAKVVGDTHNGASAIYYDKESLSGTFQTGEVLTGSDSGAEATTSSGPSDAGWAWAPVTDPVKSITFDVTGLEDNLAVGDVIEGQTSGAVGIVTEAVTAAADAVVKYRPSRGSFSAGETVSIIAPTANVDSDIGDLADPTGETFIGWPPISLRAYMDGKAITVRSARGSVAFALEVNRQARMDFTFRGVLATDGLADIAALTGIPYDNTNPPLWESSTIGYAANDASGEADLADEIEPCLNAATLDLGVQLADRKCAGAAGGLLEVRGADRQGSGSIDPEDTLEADAGWLTAVRDAGVFRLGMTVGDTAGQQFKLQAPGLQFTEASSGDRDGVMTLDMSFRMTGGDIFDLDSGASTISSIGGNNELVLFYFSA